VLADHGAIVTRILAGVVVGILVGMTGVGGGILLLPILTSVLGVPPIIAVGSDAVVNCITKIGAGFVHWKRGNVNWRLVLALGMGSVPGAVLGVLFLTKLRTMHGSGVNDFLKTAIAVLLIVIPIVSLVVRRSSPPRQLFAGGHGGKTEYGIAVIGFVVGVLVGITSIGSGTVTLVLLLLFYGFAPSVMVGTDVVHGVLLTGVTGLMQSKLGNTDYGLVGSILLGSIPGGLIGAYLANRLPSKRLKEILYVVLVVVGVRMLWGRIAHGG
jgi:uncharacterized membrane protein YfcA